MNFPEVNSLFPARSRLWAAGAALLLAVVPARAGVAEGIQHGTVAGFDVYVDHTAVQELVVVRGYFPAGDVFNPPDNPALAALTAGMLDKGTTTHTKLALARQLEGMGATISFGADSEVLSFSARCLRGDLPVVVALLAEQLRTPAFAPEEFAKYQKQMIGALKRRLDNPSARADEAFARAIFPAGHPNRPATVDELIAAVQTTKPEDLRAFHAAHYGPAHLKLVAVGDVDQGELATALQKGFTGWTGGSAQPTSVAKAAGVDAANDQTVFIPGKTSVNLVMGQATGLRYRDADSLALRAGTAILGSGFTGRLMSTVRDREGLTYGIGAGVSDDSYVDGSFQVQATFAPSLLERGVTSTRREVNKWWQDGVTDAELDARKVNLVGSFQVGLATTDGLAQNILTALQREVGPEWLDLYPSRVQSLTTAQVNTAIKKYLDPQKMVLIKAGTVGQGTAP